MSNIIFENDAWEDYMYWQEQDKKTINRINFLIKDILRNGNMGIGKPEPLRGNFSGYWSKRIDQKNRLVYKITEETILIAQCKDHYKN